MSTLSGTSLTDKSTSLVVSSRALRTCSRMQRSDRRSSQPGKIYASNKTRSHPSPSSDLRCTEYPRRRKRRLFDERQETSKIPSPGPELNEPPDPSPLKPPPRLVLPPSPPSLVLDKYSATHPGHQAAVPLPSPLSPRELLPPSLNLLSLLSLPRSLAHPSSTPWRRQLLSDLGTQEWTSLPSPPPVPKQTDEPESEQPSPILIQVSWTYRSKRELDG